METSTSSASSTSNSSSSSASLDSTVPMPSLPSALPHSSSSPAVPKRVTVPLDDKRRPEDNLPDDAEITKAMEILPKNYNFEIKKCITRLRAVNARRIGLQMPEGLLMFACMIGDILSHFTNNSEIIILGDVTFGACCVDDLGAAALDCDFLIHYGHSCLVPIDMTVSRVKMLYVFVDITFDTTHLYDTIIANFPSTMKLGLLGTIQFASSLYQLKQQLITTYPDIYIPQAKPLSPGEVLGCTSPKLDTFNLDAYIFIADGRFHLESVMIHNPSIPAYRYDPYSKRMTRESYDTPAMHNQRQAAIATASQGKRFGLILGTLGRQGNPLILSRLEKKLIEQEKEYFVLLLSEISPQRLQKFQGQVDAWIQIACPRLSIDWGTGFEHAPLLNPYEAEVALGYVPWLTVYPMDYYARGSGSWTNYYKESTNNTTKEKKTVPAVGNNLI